MITSLSAAATWKETLTRSGKNPQPKSRHRSNENVNKVLCQEYNSFDNNWYDTFQIYRRTSQNLVTFFGVFKQTSYLQRESDRIVRYLSRIIDTNYSIATTVSPVNVMPTVNGGWLFCELRVASCLCAKTSKIYQMFQNQNKPWPETFVCIDLCFPIFAAFFNRERLKTGS